MRIAQSLFMAVALSVLPKVALGQTAVVVLGVTSAEGDDAVAREVSSALRRAATQVRGWNIGSREINLSQVEIAAGCEVTEPGCLAQLSEALGTQKILYGSLRRSRNTGRIDYELTLRLFDARNGTQREERLTFGANQTDVDALRDPMRAALQRLTTSGSLPSNTTPPPTPPAASSDTATMDMQSDGIAGDEVRVDGVSVGTLNRNGRLVAPGVAVGLHRIQILRGDRVIFESTTELVASTNLVQAAVAPDTTSEIPSVRASSGNDNTLEIASWTLIGVGVAAFAGMFVTWGRILGIQGDSAYRLYQDRSVPAGLNVCTAAAGQGSSAAGIVSLCNEASTLETLQYVFLVPAILSLGAGAAMLYVSQSSNHEEEQHALQISPSFSDRGGSVTLSGTF